MFENKKELMAAFAAAQMEYPRFANNRKGRFDYLDLDEMIVTARPILFKHNLVAHWEPKGDFVYVYLTHFLTGQFIEGHLPILSAESGGKLSGPQEMGSSASYACRYALKTLLGITICDDPEDNDGDVKSYQPSNNKAASDAQKNLLKTLMQQHGHGSQWLKDNGINSTDDLTSAKASGLIKELKGE